MRFAGNNLACQNCHLDAGTNRTGLPLVGVFKTYPKFLVREQRVVSLPERLERVHDALDERPQAARRFARDGGTPGLHALHRRPAAGRHRAGAGAAVAGRRRARRRGVRHGLRRLPSGQRPRQAHGLGQRWRGYVFPPLWGPDSFNDGAGMDRYQNIVGFVRRNMPRGVDPLHPQLSLQQAWDVAAYVKSMPRPQDSRRVRPSEAGSRCRQDRLESGRGLWRRRTCGGSRPASARGTSAAPATTSRRPGSSSKLLSPCSIAAALAADHGRNSAPTSSLSSGIRRRRQRRPALERALGLGRDHALHPCHHVGRRGPHDARPASDRWRLRRTGPTGRNRPSPAGRPACTAAPADGRRACPARA